MNLILSLPRFNMNKVYLGWTRFISVKLSLFVVTPTTLVMLYEVSTPFSHPAEACMTEEASKEL